jgi:hypothetical protein
MCGLGVCVALLYYARHRRQIREADAAGTRVVAAPAGV